jgi:hypothetical protein
MPGEKIRDVDLLLSAVSTFARPHSCLTTYICAQPYCSSPGGNISMHGSLSHVSCMLHLHNRMLGALGGTSPCMVVISHTCMHAIQDLDEKEAKAKERGEGKVV